MEPLLEIIEVNRIGGLGTILRLRSLAPVDIYPGRRFQDVNDTIYVLGDLLCDLVTEPLTFQHPFERNLHLKDISIPANAKKGILLMTRD